MKNRKGTLITVSVLAIGFIAIAGILTFSSFQKQTAANSNSITGQAINNPTIDTENVNNSTEEVKEKNHTQEISDIEEKNNTRLNNSKTLEKDHKPNSDLETYSSLSSDKSNPEFGIQTRKTVHFDGSESTDKDIVNYSWDFGDGTSASGKKVNHSFAPGNHTVTLTVTDAEENTDTYSKTVKVEK